MLSSDCRLLSLPARQRRRNHWRTVDGSVLQNACPGTPCLLRLGGQCHPQYPLLVRAHHLHNVLPLLCQPLFLRKNLQCGGNLRPSPKPQLKTFRAMLPESVVFRNGRDLSQFAHHSGPIFKQGLHRHRMPCSLALQSCLFSGHRCTCQIVF